MLVRLANICNEFDNFGLHEISAKITDVMIRLSENEDDEDDEEHNHIDVNDIAKELESAVNAIEKILSRMKRKNDSVKYSSEIQDSLSDLMRLSAKNENKTLNKPFRTPGGPKKFSVYVKNDNGNVIKVNFGDPNMKIKDNIPGRRKNFRARHNCENPGPKTKARYWSCRQWSDRKSDI